MSVMHLDPAPADFSTGINIKKNSIKNRDSSFEDILIGKYLEQIQQNESKNSKQVKKIELESPYLQKLSHSNLLNTFAGFNRTGSILNSNRSNRSHRNLSRANSVLGMKPNNLEKYEPYLINQKPVQFETKFFQTNKDPSFNSTTNIETLNLSLRGLRPSSAPVKRPGSINSVRLNSTRNKKNYRRQPHMIRAVAFRNGSREISAQIAAKNITEFLQIATEKLEFTRAARRIFLENGDEIKNENHFLKNAIVYVSCGEDFSDPFLKTKKIIDKRKSIVWTSEGVQFLNPETNNSVDFNQQTDQLQQNDSKCNYYNFSFTSKTPKTDRFTKNSRLTKRLVAYANGTEHSPSLVVLEYLNSSIKDKIEENEIEKLEKAYMNDFLIECTNRMNMNCNAKLVYNWDGVLVKSLSDVPKLDKCLQSLVSEVEYAPVWVSKGEGFDARGALYFIENLIKYTKINRKELREKLNKLNKKLENIKNENIQNKAIHIRLLEVNQNIKKTNLDIDELSQSISNLESILSNLQMLLNQQNANGYQSLFKHIKSLDTNERIFGGLSSKGVKLKCYQNGTDYSFDVFFNIKDWSNSDAQQNNFYQLLSEISRVYNKNNSTLIKFTRVFSESGEEIKLVNKLTNNDVIWVSQGENWKGPKEPTLALSLCLNSLFSMKNSNNINMGSYETQKSTQLDPELETKQDEGIEDEEDDIDYDDDDMDEDLKKYFRKKPKNEQKLVKNSTSQAFIKNDYNSEFNFKTYIEPLNPHALKKYDKTEFWDILNERESLEKLNESAYEFNQTFLKEECVEIELKKATQILIKSKALDNFYLNPQLKMNEKVKRNQTKADSLWFHDFQIWKFNKAGFIYNQFFPKICLQLNTAISVKLEINLKNIKSKNNKEWNEEERKIFKKGYAIVLGTRELSDKNDYRDKDQQWCFNKYGNLLSKALNDKTMVLTSADVLLKELNNLYQQPNQIIEKYELQISESNLENYKELNPREISIFLLESFDSQPINSLSTSQRWAIKQENARSIGEWRFSELSTSLWHKLGLTWPVDEKENLIENFKWPISGYLLPGAPSLKNLEDSQNQNIGSRLKVLKNGSIDFNNAISLSRLSAKNMIKEYIHCSKLSYKQFEFNNFLDTCTNALGLPNAARRIFDSQGVEHFELTNLKSEEYIFVSMGEPWIHPKQIREEQEKKIALTGLSDDLNKILYFNKLKMCENFVIETSNISIQDGSKLVLGPCCLSFSQIERIKQGESIQTVIEVENKDDDNLNDQKPKKAHEISHENSDAIYSKKFRWPWEIIANKSMEGVFEKRTDDENEDGTKETDTKDSKDQELSDRFKPKPRKSLKNLKLTSQKFAFNKSQGFIYSMDYPNLVFGLLDIENNQTEVILMKKNEDNVNQRWVYKQNGIIYSKAKSNLVLTVKLPALESTDSDITSLDSDQDYYKKSIIKDSLITVQPLIDFEVGNAHQKWFIDESIGFIYAFATPDQKDIEITSANKAGICTYYVTYDKELSQPGYYCDFIIDVPIVGNENQTAQRVDKVLICSSCAKSIRGKFKLTKLSKNTNFTCFMGKSKDKNFKQYDGFKYLHDKVDLSSNEAENTLIKWHEKFINWRHEKNAKTVLNELSSYKKIDIIKLYAYKNGEGRLKSGEFLVGSSIQGLLEQATNKLQLRNAARRLYTEDGTLILDINDLITWSIEYYRKELYRSETNDSNSINNKINKPTNKDKDASKSEQNTNLLEKVNFGEAANHELTKNNSTESLSNYETIQKMPKPFNGPSKSDIKRLLNEYDRTSKIDVKKLLRWPIEIWVSCGEQFVQPKLVSKIENKKMIQREQIDKAEHELEIQTHLLRQMAGRRLTSMNNGQYKSIKNPDIPVVKEGHWSEIPYEEQIKKNEVNKLKDFVDEIKNPNKKSDKNTKNTSNLYGSHHVTKRILIYINGESAEKAVHCWASNLDELNETAKIKLRLNKPIKFFYSRDGKIISRFEDITRDQLVCVSTGREFITPEIKNKELEIKANWSRVKKEEGIEATNIKVDSKRNPIVNVDPFGPPLLSTSNKQQTLALPPAPPVTAPVKQPESNLSQKEKFNKEKSEHHTEINRRPVSAKPPSLKKHKKKSKSPKRVQISNDPKDLPTLSNMMNDSVSFGGSKESNLDEIEESFINEDILDILE